MLTALTLFVLAGAVLVLTLLGVVVVAIRQEPRDMEMSDVAPSLVAVVVRRMLGVYLRSPLPRRTASRSGCRTRGRPHLQTEGGEETLQAYTVEQVAEMLHVGRDKVYYLLTTGQLRRINEQQLADFIARLTTPG